jgi:hypothetical protein
MSDPITSSTVSSMNDYWKNRSGYNYYKKVVEIIKKYENKCDSIIDVGASNTEILSNFSFKEKVCLDYNKLPDIENVKTIKCDFYKWVPDKKYDIVTCLQVLEHLDNPELFAKKLFDLSDKIVIISLPYKWKKGFCIHHVQDPVDEDKIYSWTQRTPDERYIIEDFSVQRIICVYQKLS